MIRFTAYGRPVAQGSKRAYVRGGHVVLVEMGKNLSSWRDSIRLAAAEQMTKTGTATLRGPVHVRACFYLDRPNSHYGTGRNQHALRPSAPSRPAVSPDLDKLARALLDALTGTVIHDDKQVVTLTCAKVYADTHMSGVDVEVTEL